MKKFVCIVVILLLLGGCFLTGKDGKRGERGTSGSSGPAGEPGQDAVVSTKVYTSTTTGAGNPALYDAPVINLNDVESGKQTVDAYMYIAELDEWVPLPATVETAGNHVDHFMTVGHGYVRYESYENSILVDPDALYGRSHMIIVKNYAK